MAHQEKIDYLLLDIRELEKKVASVRDAAIYPVTFFSQTFQLAHKILTDLHQLEANQLEELSRQMEEHRARLAAIPAHDAPQPSPSPRETDPDPTPGTHEQQNEKETTIPHREKAPIEEATPPPADPKETTQAEFRSAVSLNEILEKKKLSDFRKAFSLNDRFRFRRELFGGDEGRMNKAIADLNKIESYEESVAYLNDELEWNVEDEAIADFMKLIEKRFL